ncbi:MAG: PKD domain-containing protein [Bacteroidetes bacterium]|nr:PKD domain-containing protein [Bacteroidota bacterium]MBU1720939.1 PKD domain-containing protein [Bacteroidota bacterium]
MKKIILLLSFVLSAPFLFSQNINSVSPDTANRRTTLSVEISGQNTHFGQGTSTTNVWFNQGTVTMIYPNNINIIDSSKFEAEFSFGYYLPTGVYDVTVDNTTDGVMVLPAGFTLLQGSVAALISATPSYAAPEQTLDVEISGQNTNFIQGTGTTNVWFNQGTFTINANYVDIINDTTLNANISIPYGALTGLYNVNTSSTIAGDALLVGAFRVAYGALDNSVPTSGYQNQHLTVEVSGQYTHFGQGTTTTNVWFEQGTITSIAPHNVTIVSPELLRADFSFTGSDIIGTYDLVVSDEFDGDIYLPAAFTLSTCPTIGIITAINGVTVVCEADVTVFSIPTVVNSDTCFWEIAPPIAGVITGNNDVVSVNWNAGFTGPATLSVFATSVCDTSNTASLVIDVLPPPTVFAGNDTTIFESDVLQLAGTAEYASSIFWVTSGDGSFSDSAVLFATYTPGISDALLGSATLTLNGVSSACPTATDMMNVDITPIPGTCWARIAAEPYSGNTILFRNLSTGGSTGDFWDFGDGQYSNATGDTVFHVFSGTGFYNVCLTITDTIQQCQDDTCILVSVNPTPSDCNAKFSYTDIGGTQLSFSSLLSAGNLTNWFWDFGDGGSSIQQNPQHTFAADGYFYVSLTVEDSVSSCMSNIQKIVSVGDVQYDCEADFTYFSDLQHKKVHFVSTSSGSMTDNYVWNFGDGSFAFSPDTSHTFQTSAFYHVCLTTFSSVTGCGNTSCKTIKVGTNDQSCHASFVYAVDSTSNKAANSSVDFKGTAFGDPAKTAWNIRWDFGDGTFDTTSLFTTHVYADTGLYQVHLQISSAACSDDYFDLVNVGLSINEIIGAFFYTIDTTSKSQQYPIDFKGAAFGDPAIISWDFGDGSPVDSTTWEPTHTYELSGDYVVCFTVSDPNISQLNTTCDTVNIPEIMSVFNSNKDALGMTIYPNPVNHFAAIAYYLPVETNARLVISDICGKQAELIVDKQHQAGSHTIIWENKSLSKGIYLLTLETESGTKTLRLVIQ